MPDTCLVAENKFTLNGKKALQSDPEDGARLTSVVMSRPATFSTAKVRDDSLSSASLVCVGTPDATHVDGADATYACPIAPLSRCTFSVPPPDDSGP